VQVKNVVLIPELGCVCVHGLLPTGDARSRLAILSGSRLCGVMLYDLRVSRVCCISHPLVRTEATTWFIICDRHGMKLKRGTH
jgi:hypothetical protein